MALFSQWLSFVASAVVVYFQICMVTVSAEENASCIYEPVPGKDGYYRFIDNPTEEFKCVDGMVFSFQSCVCVPLGTTAAESTIDGTLGDTTSQGTTTTAVTTGTMIYWSAITREQTTSSTAESTVGDTTTQGTTTTGVMTGRHFFPYETTTVETTSSTAESTTTQPTTSTVATTVLHMTWSRPGETTEAEWVTTGTTTIGDRYDWEEWSECSRSCGGGTQTKYAYCGGIVCNRVEMSCNLMPCDDPFDGVPWSTCSAPCGGGTRRRETNTDPIIVQEIACNTQACKPITGDCEADLIFVLDSSASYGALQWFIQKQFVIDIIQSLKVAKNQIRVGVISFSTMVRVDISLGQFDDVSLLTEAVWDIDYMAGVTSLKDALREMQDMFRVGKRSHAKQIAVILTDSGLALDPMHTVKAAKDAADDGIAIHVIATNGADDDGGLTSIASDKALFYTSPNFDVRDQLVDSINGMACELDECRLCDFTHGQIWLRDTANCHMFYLCEKVKVGEYRKQHMTCGDLWWKQEIHTCVRSPPEGCDVNVAVNTYVPPSTSEAPCPYEPVPDREGYFRLIGSPNEIFRCGDGMAFLHQPCGCVPMSEINPTCADDLLLHFPYEDHYNDVTCHGAVATQYGEGVERRFDAARLGSVACFSGKTHFEVSFLRTWFAENEVDKFSVAVWYQRQGHQPGVSTIVSNSNCKQSAGFSVSTSTSAVTGSITSDGRHVVVDVPQAADADWHHAAWVYNGHSLKLYIDGVLRNHQLAYAEGFMQNNDVPMHIGNDCAGNYFVGCLDELRVYERALSVDDVRRLMKLPLP